MLQKNGVNRVTANDSVLKRKSERFLNNKLGKVVVLMGGIAAEREVSLKSGQAIFEGLKNKKIDVVLVDVTSVEQIVALKNNFDCVFNAIHGRWGEDGGVQAVLDAIRLPYVGSGMASSALAMDKLRSKWLWQGVNLSTPEFLMVSEEKPFLSASYKMGFPVIVKPVREGSSIGMKKANSLNELTDAIKFAKQYDSEILVEKWITGREFTCAIIDGIALPLIELKTSHDFYDFDAKYKSNDTQYICPVELNGKIEEEMQNLSLQAFHSLGCKGWGRVDLMLDEKQKPWLIEVNTIPGMTDHSLVPMAAKVAGLSFDDLVVLLVGLAK